MRRLPSELKREFGRVDLHMEDIEDLYRFLQESQDSFRATLPAEALKLESESDSLSYSEYSALRDAVTAEDRSNVRRLMKGITIYADDYIFDSLDELRGLPNKSIGVLILRTAYPDIKLLLGRLSEIVVGEDTTHYKGVFQSGCEKLASYSVHRKKLGLLISGNIIFWSLQLSMFSALFSRWGFLQPVRSNITFFIFLMIASCILNFILSRWYNAKCISLKYKIEDPGFFQSKGEDVRTKIVLIVVTAVAASLITILVQYVAGHTFGPAAPVPSPPSASAAAK